MSSAEDAPDRAQSPPTPEALLLPSSDRPSLPAGPYALTDRRLAGGRGLEEIVEALLAGGVRLIQIREKKITAGGAAGEDTDPDEGKGKRKRPETPKEPAPVQPEGPLAPLTPTSLLDTIRECVGLVRSAGGVLIVNDDPDLAVAMGADGVHVGQDDCPPQLARAVVGPRRIVGLSTHTREQFLAALEEPVDYVAIGPVFGTTSKESPYAALGLEFVAWAGAEARERGMPLVAIGGISLSNLKSLLDAAPVVIPAAIGAFMTEGNIEARAREFVAAMEAIRAGHGGTNSNFKANAKEKGLTDA